MLDVVFVTTLGSSRCDLPPPLLVPAVLLPVLPALLFLSLFVVLIMLLLALYSFEPGRLVIF